MVDEPGLLAATDPRWVLAVRAGLEMGERGVLPPESRERLLKLGKSLGLTPFSANLVLAVVQDGARRGVPRVRCAAAGARELAVIPAEPQRSASRGWSGWRTAWVLVALLAGELAAVWWWMG